MTRFRALLVLVAALALTVGVTTAAATSSATTTVTSGSGKSPSAKQCQKDGYLNWMRANGSRFANSEDCMDYAAQKGNTLLPLCTPSGSENFSGDAEGSQPTTFSGGTIDSGYGQFGKIVVSGSSWINATIFSSGTHLLFTGWAVSSFRLTFTNPAASVRLNMEKNVDAFTFTLTGYDASDSVVSTQSTTTLNSLSISSTSNNIKYFVLSADPSQFGFAFTNIVWGCV